MPHEMQPPNLQGAGAHWCAWSSPHARWAAACCHRSRRRWTERQSAAEGSGGVRSPRGRQSERTSE
eukprot:CAMPEP_0182542590 /NCGR_PEP_ID=MMETSP1323-20130603/30385_2 /TAXON_ID=236787 /ORGANISM="Florenciella parvula, Strain RCC1693" /LENGTH=65 /DNA_ID=CAMNT_0024753453 /DNA_START=110 /DNA_END=304 /DNA_ORIENTATION=-